MFVGALVQNFGGGPFELPSIDKNWLIWLAARAPLTPGGACALHNPNNSLLRHCLLPISKHRSEVLENG